LLYVLEIPTFNQLTVLQVDNMTFGRPTRYVQLDIGAVSEFVIDRETAFDDAVLDASKLYERRMHNICCQNCHHHVAEALNRMGYQRRHNWTQVDVWWMILTKGRWISYVAACACVHVAM